MSQAKKRKVPMRKCVVTGESHPKKDLIRIVRTPEGTIEIDPTGKKNGRGAYISLDPELAIQAEKKKVFNRTFEMEIDKEFYQELYRFLDHQKARKELL
ncbi:RNase P modulator RnpM [Facklamia sp. P12945]|uniref:RNase P modulator RnpM n=1 Tax=unclassified Facklamia TaxID=2622293 RepID=UPI003D16DC02